MQQDIFWLEWQQLQPHPKYLLYQLPQTEAWSLMKTSSSYLLFTTLLCLKQASSPSFSSTITLSPLFSTEDSAPYFRIISPILPEFSPACFCFTFLNIFSVRVGRAVELSSEWCFSTWSNANRSCSSRKAFSPTAYRLESSLRNQSYPTRVRDLGSKAAEFRSKLRRYFALSSLFLTPPSPWNFSFLLPEGRVAERRGLSCNFISSSSSPLTFFLTSSQFLQSSMTQWYISGVKPFHLSLFTSQLIRTSLVTSSAAMFLFVNLAATFLGLSVQSLRLCPIPPQFSQAPFRQAVD